MKVLQLCNKPPFPPVDGGCIAMNAITDGLLANGHQVKVLAIATHKHPFLEDKIPVEYKKKTKIEVSFVDTKVSAGSAFANLFSKKSYNIERFISQEFSDKIASALQQETYDAIHLESLYVTPYIATIRKYSKAPIVLRAHNIEYKLWEQQAASAKFFAKKSYLKLLAKRIKAYEIDTIQQIDGIAAITEEDKASFMQMGYQKPIDVFPVGVDSSRYHIPKKKPEFPSIFHLGSMDWTPNIEGVSWFLEKVWPEVATKYPDLKCYIAGRKMPEWLLDLELNNVVVESDVPSAVDFINSKSIMIVPLLSGSGMRVKIIEGMALGKTIVSTSTGAEGIELTDGKNILIADQPEDFIKKIGQCVEDQKYCESIGVNARDLIKEKYENTNICRNLAYFYQQLITSN